MNKTRMSQTTGLGLILITLFLLAGCQPQEVVPVEAAPAESILPEEAAALVRVDPADRKFYSSAYVSAVTARELSAAASIAPADRKFYSAGSDPLAGIHAADRKFVIGVQAVSRAAAPMASIAPADRKFFNWK